MSDWMATASFRDGFVRADAEGVVYLDSAGKAQLPRSVLDIGVQALKRKRAPWRGFGDDPSEEIRTLYAGLINATPDEIAICPSTSYAMSTIAHNVAALPTLRKGAAVIVLANQMASNVMPWQRLCKTRGLTLTVVPEPPIDGASGWADAVLKAMRTADDVAVVALPAVHWCTGRRIDLVRVSTAVHASGGIDPPRDRPLFVVDGTQSIGAMPFDVAVIRPDVVACSVHKWLASPYGCSLLFVARRLHDAWVGIEQHERNREGSDHPDWDALGVMRDTGYPDVYKGGARRFDAGGRPNPVILPMVREALRLVREWTPVAIQSHCASLAGVLRRGLADIRCADGSAAYRWDPDGCEHIVGVAPSEALRVRGITAVSLGRGLANRHIVLSVRAGWLRVALWLPNTERDVLALLTVLRDEAASQGEQRVAARL